MKKTNEFEGWVTATCKNKKCEKAFLIYDKKGEFNDEPTTKFYCPICEKNGFKNKKEKETPEKFLKRMGIIDKIVKREFKKICKTRSYRRTYDNILKEAIEVAGYYRDEC